MDMNLTLSDETKRIQAIGGPQPCVVSLDQITTPQSGRDTPSPFNTGVQALPIGDTAHNYQFGKGG